MHDGADNVDVADDERAEDEVDQFMRTVDADLRGQTDRKEDAGDRALSTDGRTAPEPSEETGDSQVLVKRDISAFEQQQGESVL